MRKKLENLNMNMRKKLENLNMNMRRKFKYEYEKKT